MAKFLIRRISHKELISDEGFYRGIDRFSTPDDSNNSDNSLKINEAYKKHSDYIDSSGDTSEIISDYEFAAEISELFSNYNDMNEFYEVIEITNDLEAPEHFNVFIGFDVIDIEEGQISIIENFYKDLSPSFQLVNYNYMNLLNKFHLFNNYRDAVDFVEISRNSLIKVFGKCDIRIFGIYVDTKLRIVSL